MSLESLGLENFLEIWAVDFEFIANLGERPIPICMVAWELKTGRKLRLWQDQLEGRKNPPYSVDDNALFVAYYASAELGCHLALGWPTPINILDLFCEFRNAMNGIRPICGHSLLGAMAHYGLDTMDAAEKGDMRNLIMRGGPWSEFEKRAIFDYCEADVASLAKLLPCMIFG